MVRTVGVSKAIATVDLSLPFATGRSSESMLARLGELAHTLTGIQGTRKVQLLMDGRATAGMFPGASTSAPITLRFRVPRLRPAIADRRVLDVRVRLRRKCPTR
jgi:hypothetical protein